MIKKYFRKNSLAIWAYKKIIYYKNLCLFIKDFFVFKKLSKSNNRFPLLWKNRRPFLMDKTTGTNFDRHYTLHPAWAARIIAQTKPELHTDISSIFYFSTIVSAFTSVKFYDYRPADLKLDNLTSGSADLTNLLFKDNSIHSLSCMHTVEHIGLGRYGDKIDPNGDLKAMSELKRVLAIQGNLLFVVPIGKEKLAFNANRIYSYDQIIENFSDLRLEEFSLIPDDPKDGGIIKNPTRELINKQSYACGCFWFKKI